MERNDQTLQQERENHGRRSDVQQLKQQAQLSPAVSPSHEFTFTIRSTPMKILDKSKCSSLTIDLSPADDIFFHGHLLPLRLLSHVPTSPRSSANSSDSFTLPINESSHHNNNSDNGTISNDCCIITDYPHDQENDPFKLKQRKSRFLSLLKFGIQRKAKEKDHHHHQEDGSEGEKMKSRFIIRHVVKRYVKPFLAFINRRRSNAQLHRDHHSYSFSGNLLMRSKKDPQGRRVDEYSAPASMISSRTNSGLLVASGSITPTNFKSDSTMEELQAAIQAAIAHCKNTLASDDQIKLP